MIARPLARFLLLALAFLSSSFFLPAAQADVDPAINGIWVRELREGDGASLYIGPDGNYFLTYVGKRYRPGTFGKLDAANGTWTATVADGNKNGSYEFRSGDRLIWVNGNERSEWHRPPSTAERVNAVSRDRGLYDKETMLALLNGSETERRLGGRGMLASAGSLLNDESRNDSSRRTAVTPLPDGGTKIEIGGTYYYYYSDGSTSMDSGDTLADAVYNNLMNGRNDAAIEASNRMIARDPNNPNIYINLAEAYLQKDDSYSQISAADRAIALASAGWAVPELGRGFHRSYQAGPFDVSARDQLRSALSSGYRQRGIGYFFLGNYGQAVTDLTRSSDYAKTPNADNSFFRGQAYTNLGRNREALSDFNETIRLDPKHPMSYCLRALVHKRLGDSKSAAADLAELRALKPEAEARCAAVHGTP